MGGVWNLHHVGCRKVGGDVAKDTWMKTGILHSPQDLHWRVGQRRQTGHEVIHQRGCGVGLGEGNVTDEAPDRAATTPGAVGMVIAALDLLRQRVHDAE